MSQKLCVTTAPVAAAVLVLAGTVIGKTSPVPALAVAVKSITTVMACLFALAAAAAAEVIERNAHSGLAAPPEVPLPVASASSPAIGFTCSVKRSAGATGSHRPDPPSGVRAHATV